MARLRRGLSLSSGACAIKHIATLAQRVAPNRMRSALAARSAAWHRPASKRTPAASRVSARRCPRTEALSRRRARRASHRCCPHAALSSLGVEVSARGDRILRIAKGVWIVLPVVVAHDALHCVAVVHAARVAAEDLGTRVELVRVPVAKLGGHRRRAGALEDFGKKGRLYEGQWPSTR